MNNKIKLNFNYALVIFFTTIMYTSKLNIYLKSELLNTREKYCNLIFEKKMAFIPILSLKKNQ
ncbi:hypothetical protein (chloroplast) [Porphyra umbilicalis]|uniref:Uncharacterized protein n=1 Tax=Porphyra umbilicalis TaxID=2786 RepID=J7F651_PORUM|nr:hypothetical protein [Porphyra umbilicalis]AFC39903.1 hypothetical protein [Porphyra umbilicalis]ASN78707.1 hypothetical protein [Porphyra umbilicalis]|eukprot:ASN78707.1 hypothetical protein (chloroplast) [Porphyra umbilicalis]